MNDQATARNTAARAAVAAGSGAVPKPQAVRRWPVSPRYLTCLSVLIVSAVAMQILAARMRWFLNKEALPLKKPLSLLDQSKLLPDYRLAAIQPPPLEEDLIENLGTREYLNWYLEDRRRSPTDPTYLARLFITYYTGKPNLVPHNPRECLAAGGWTLAGEQIRRFAIRRPGDGVARIPVSVLQFEPPARGSVFETSGSETPTLTVVYFFYANGHYVTSRSGVRMAIYDPRDRYAFYMKIELSFTDASGRRLPGPQQTTEAARRLLEKLMPILWSDHLPDWPRTAEPAG